MFVWPHVLGQTIISARAWGEAAYLMADRKYREAVAGRGRARYTPQGYAPSDLLLSTSPYLPWFYHL
jgi:hypothetical protein